LAKTLEVLIHKSGYIPGEQLALHTRRRFRLVAAPNRNPQQAPQPDPSLWIVHYGPSDAPDRLPVNMIPYEERVHTILQTRAYLKRCGQIHRKDFMIGDQRNWPQLQFPRDGGRQQMYATPLNARGVPQQMAYPPQTPTGPPSKRARHAAQAQQGQPMHPQQMNQQMQAQQIQQLHMDPAFDDDEDILRGDMFDQYTPREMAMGRYQQNHEWMEEILSSAYRIGQVNPPDLGLGLKGELEHLTDGVFPAQAADALQKVPDKPYNSPLDPEMAEEFRKRIAKFMDASKAEIETMKGNHAKSMAAIRANSLIMHAEKDIRNSVQDFGHEMWRLEGKLEDGDDSSGRWSHKHKDMDEVVAKVEAHLGKKVGQQAVVHRLQDGGYQPPPEVPVMQSPPALLVPAALNGSAAPSHKAPSVAPSHGDGMGMDDPDLEMGGTAGELLAQIQPGMSSTSTPGPQTSALPSAVATPANLNVPSPAPPLPGADPKSTTTGGDAAGRAGDAGKENGRTAPDQGTGSGDWIVVPKGGVSPEPPQATTGPAADAIKATAPVPRVPSATGTPVEAGSTTFDNDFSSLGDLDTAGDALASYEGPSGGDLVDMDLAMDMDDSAFGDAFHAGTPASANPENM
jgi:hypothetical protein